MRMNYWSNSALADRIRGTKKPPYATMEEWDEWGNESHKIHPVRHWIAEEGLDRIQDVFCFIPDVIRSVKHYIANIRYGSHVLSAPKDFVKRGQWADLYDKVLYCLFHELQKFVEWECAKANGAKAPSAVGGVEYLKWCINLKDDTAQCVHAKEILDLYYWWTFDRPVRKDPYDEDVTLDDYVLMIKGYYSEDQQMLHRLIDVRESLWT